MKIFKGIQMRSQSGKEARRVCAQMRKKHFSFDEDQAKIKRAIALLLLTKQNKH